MSVRVDFPLAHVARVVLCRPDKCNALNGALLSDLYRALMSLCECADLRVVLLAAEGKAFCTGLDLNDSDEDNAALLAKILYRLYTFPFITIAIVHGAVMGGGGALLLACDIALAGEEVVLSFPEMLRGLVPYQVLVLMKRKLAAHARHAFLLSSGRFTAAEAQSLGLVTHIFSSESLGEEALAYALKAAQAAPHALLATKELITDGEAITTLQEELTHAAAMHASTITTPEALEGMASFKEKRSPSWMA